MSATNSPSARRMPPRSCGSAGIGVAARDACRYGQQRQIEPLGGGLEVLERAIADAARGDVDDAAEGHRVGVVADQAQVGEQVAHLAAVVEARPADDAVADALLDAGLLDGARLRVRAVHHGEVGEGARVFAHQSRETSSATKWPSSSLS